MAELRLGKALDKTRVKPIAAVMPDFNQALADYAALYAATYGRGEAVVEAILAMLAAFLEGDRAYLCTHICAK